MVLEGFPTRVQETPFFQGQALAGSGRGDLFTLDCFQLLFCAHLLLFGNGQMSRLENQQGRST